MEDIFYLAEQNLEVEKIVVAICGAGLQISRILILEDRDLLYCQFNDGSYWEWYRMTEKNGSYQVFEKEVTTRFAQLKVKEVFCITHHYYSLNDLRMVLKIIMDKYKGWASLDDSEFCTLYGHSEIEKLDYY